MRRASSTSWPPSHWIAPCSDCLVELTRGLGVIADIGCGPGQIARYLADHGAQAMGIDLSPEMVRLAQRLSPDIPFCR